MSRRKPLEKTDENVADAFASLLGIKQIGVLVHSPSVNVDNWEEEQEAAGLTVARCEGHSRLYKLPQA